MKRQNAVRISVRSGKLSGKLFLTRTYNHNIRCVECVDVTMGGVK